MTDVGLMSMVAQLPSSMACFDRERSEMIGGCLELVTSQVGKGTQISFSYGGNQ